MPPIDPMIYWALAGAAYSALEYWLGRTDKVKAGSVAEMILQTLAILGRPFIKK